MLGRLSRFLGSMALAGTVPLGATAGEYYGDDPCSYHQRGCAVQSPLESPDGPAKHKHHHQQATCVPYYISPLTPVSSRWCSTDCHGHLIIVPYYRGYCRWFHKHGPCDLAGAAANLDFCGPLGPEAGTYGPLSGAPKDEASLLHLGGNGFVPYGTCGPDHPAAPTEEKPEKGKMGEKVTKQEAGKVEEKPQSETGKEKVEKQEAEKDEEKPESD